MKTFKFKELVINIEEVMLITKIGETVINIEFKNGKTLPVEFYHEGARDRRFAQIHKIMVSK